MSANIVNYDILPLRVVSQEVVLDVYVLSVAVFNGIIHHADWTHCHIGEGLCSTCSHSP